MADNKYESKYTGNEMDTATEWALKYKAYDVKDMNTKLTRAISSSSSLSTSLNREITRAKAAESKLQTNIDNLNAKYFQIRVEIIGGKPYVKTKNLSALLSAGYTPYFFRRMKSSHAICSNKVKIARRRHKGWCKYGFANCCSVSSTGEIKIVPPKSLKTKYSANVGIAHTNTPTACIWEYVSDKDSKKYIKWGHKKVASERYLRMQVGIAFVSGARTTDGGEIDVELKTNLATFSLVKSYACDWAWGK